MTIRLGPTWAERYHDEVKAWLRPFEKLYAKYGHSPEDIQQEARLALVQQEEYIHRENGDQHGVKAGIERLCKTIALRAVKRRLLGRRADVPEHVTPESWDAVHEAESREHNAHIRLELAEAVAAAPPEIYVWLGVILGNAGPFDVGVVETVARDATSGGALRRAAADYLLNWFSNKFDWNTRSKL